MSEQDGKFIWGNHITFGIIKPDAVRDGKMGAILQRITDAGFKIRAMKLIHLTKTEAEGFYAVHRERPFFGELTTFMSSGPCVVMALQKENGVKAWRDLMGATDPAKADEGTLRKDFANSIGENAVHGSDSLDNAKTELAYFFSQLEIVQS
ncbi:MAG TPA: nucleoside-diphosphate kinase [Pyrinomonadaceae bacterium]|jgi:nucleoside-diphosphate kinase